MVEYETMRWQEMDLSAIAIEAGYGLMLLRYKGFAEAYVDKIRDGVRLLELLATGEKAIARRKVETSQEANAYLAVQKVLSSGKAGTTSQILRDELKSSVQKGKLVTKRLTGLLQDPETFAKEEMEDYQQFFADLGSILRTL